VTIQKASPIAKIIDYLDENRNPVKSKKDAYWIHEVHFDNNGNVGRCRLWINLDQSTKHF